MRISKHRHKEWLTATSGETLATANTGTISSVSIATAGFQGAAGNASDFTKPTIVRIVGNVGMRLAAATNLAMEMVVTMGWIVMPNDLTAPRDPTTDESRSWMWWKSLFLTNMHAGGTYEQNAGGSASCNVGFDIRVGRKLNPGETVAFNIRPDGPVNSQLRWYVSGRVLVAE